MDRRDFLKKAAAGSAAVAVGGTAIGGASLLGGCSGGNAGKANGSGNETAASKANAVRISRNAEDSRMHLTFEPYELQLRHVFTVSSYSRKTTPGVQVKIEYQGVTGYGEASMPPYLGQSVETVTAFLRKVDLKTENPGLVVTT